ncbi:hypothetical protein [Arthrobacter cheniae]|uniref:hypothetical protein n=1 Tax=Arthrobacter cheniae TaxID=1258888 RepID=UPI001F3764C9|nr:hypothetical protein [Arthrobacter cheniae]
MTSAFDERDAGGYADLRTYAIGGHGRTIELAACGGRIDGLPLPDISMPAAFAALLDAENGGYLSLSPVEPFTVSRRYVEGFQVHLGAGLGMDAGFGRKLRGLKVTPDIRPGDTVSIKFAGTEAGSTLIQDTYVTANSVLDGNTVTVRGHVGAGVNRAQMEQRVIDPALKDTSIGRRDVRAVAGPLTADEGYSSSLEFGVDGPDTFTATYIFDETAAAELAANAGGARAMAWQEEDIDANRQGLTIAEFGELGGPGMGGCPNGPLQSGPAGPTTVAAVKVNGEQWYLDQECWLKLLGSRLV